MVDSKHQWKAWVYLAPAIILLLIFTVYPIFNTIRIAFLNGYSPLENQGGNVDWKVGIENFIKVVTVSDFKTCLSNTLVLTVLTVPLSCFIALLIAVFLNNIPHFSKVFQTIYFLPYVTNSIAIGMVFAMMFNIVGQTPTAVQISQQGLAGIAKISTDQAAYVYNVLLNGATSASAEQILTAINGVEYSSGSEIANVFTNEEFELFKSNMVAYDNSLYGYYTYESNNLGSSIRNSSFNELINILPIVKVQDLFMLASNNVSNTEISLDTLNSYISNTSNKDAIVSILGQTQYDTVIANLSSLEAESGIITATNFSKAFTFVTEDQIREFYRLAITASDPSVTKFNTTSLNVLHTYLMDEKSTAALAEVFTTSQISFLKDNFESLIVRETSEMAYQAASVGIINNILGWFGVDPINWINPGSSHTANMAVMVIYIVWNALPFKILILLGGLQSVNKQYYDAAKIDGASRGRVFWRITVPLLSPMIAYVVITAFIGGFKEYTSIVGIFGVNMGAAGAPNSMNTMVGYIYNAISGDNYGLASAAALILFVIILFVTLINLYVSKKKVHY